jgi:3,4-dihydroxy-2-butanone 4-phosphate synthase
MEEQALSATLETLRKGKCIAILDSKSKEAETDLFFPTTSFSPLSLKTLKTKTGGEPYIFLAHEVASIFSFLFIGVVSITHP